MVFVVMEIQTDSEGIVQTLVTQHATRREAESKFYTVLSYAAISEVATHAAVLLDSRGNYIMSQSYVHSLPVSE